MTKTVVGIDPGAKGYACFFDGDRLEFLPMPIIAGIVQSEPLLAWVLERSPDFIFVEHSQAIPGVGSTSSSFKFGENYGKVCATAEISLIPFELVKPKAWQKKMHRGITADVKAKEKSLLRARMLFPKYKFFKTKDGEYDSCLIAVYGFNRINGVG